MSQQIPLSGPDITQAEIDAVVGVLQTPNLSLGPKLQEFEDAFRQRLGVRHAIATNSGTCALHLLWRSLGVKTGDEVITTPFSFIASANSIMFDGAAPRFVDIDPDTWQIDASQIPAAINQNTRAILPVDIFGSVPDMDAILAVAHERGLHVFEDSCEALGTTYRGHPAGTLTEAGVFGFYPNKQITTGEGGMVVTNDDQIAAMVRSLRNQGRDPDASWLQHARLGFNYRMSDISSALGAVQMQRLDEIVGRRAQVAQWYRERLSDESHVAMMRIPDEVEMSWFVMVVRLTDDYTMEDRDTILDKLRNAGIGCSNYFTPIHLQPFYQERFGYKTGDFPQTEALSARTIALPFFNLLPEEQVDYVVTELKKAL